MKTVSPIFLRQTVFSSSLKFLKVSGVRNNDHVLTKYNKYAHNLFIWVEALCCHQKEPNRRAFIGSLIWTGTQRIITRPLYAPQPPDSHWKESDLFTAAPLRLFGSPMGAMQLLEGGRTVNDGAHGSVPPLPPEPPQTKTHTLSLTHTH